MKVRRESCFAGESQKLILKLIVLIGSKDLMAELPFGFHY